MPRPRRRNPWVSVAEVATWVLFAALLFPAGFAGWAIGHYTSLGKPSGTRTVTVTTPGNAAPTTTAAAAPTTTAQAATGGSAAAGKTLFASSGCGACHTFAPAGTHGTVGPDLAVSPAQGAKATHMSLDAFLKQSIVDPNAYIAPGYSKGIMPDIFGKQLSPKQIDDLVAFLASGAK